MLLHMKIYLSNLAKELNLLLHIHLAKCQFNPQFTLDGLCYAPAALSEYSVQCRPAIHAECVPSAVWCWTAGLMLRSQCRS